MFTRRDFGVSVFTALGMLVPPLWKSRKGEGLAVLTDRVLPKPDFRVTPDPESPTLTYGEYVFNVESMQFTTDLNGITKVTVTAVRDKPTLS